MDRTKLLSGGVVGLVVLWSAVSVAELFLTTLSVGPHVRPAAVTVAFVGVALLLGAALGARGRRWLDNPAAYW